MNEHVIEAYRYALMRNDQKFLEGGVPITVYQHHRDFIHNLIKKESRY